MFCNWFFLTCLICAVFNAWLAPTQHALHGIPPYAVFTMQDERLMLDFPPWIKPIGSELFNFLFFFLPSLVIAIVLTIIWGLGNAVLKRVRSQMMRHTIKWHLIIYAGFVIFFSWVSLAIFWDDGPAYQNPPGPDHLTTACWLSAIYLHLIVPFVAAAIPTGLCAALCALWTAIMKLTTWLTRTNHSTSID